MRGWCEYELKELDDTHKRAVICGVSDDKVRKGVKGIILSKSLEESSSKAATVLKRGQWPRFYFTKNGKGGIARKTYIDNVGGVPPTNLWEYSKVGHTDESKKEMLAIFDGKAAFDTPKPSRLIEYVLTVAGDKSTLILDSFAGSGTTAHAVLNMNKQDGGNRKFILIEMMDYADSITAERVKRVIDGYGEDKKKVEGTGGGFTFYELGEKLLNGEYLNENVGLDKIREYIYFTETKQPVEDKADEPHYLGTFIDTAYYFYYDKENVTTLDRDFLHTIKTKAAHYVIYADKCILSDTELEKYNITFKKIPRDITRL
jgi:adenine-specific DNA-methyltransferase